MKNVLYKITKVLYVVINGIKWILVISRSTLIAAFVYYGASIFPVSPLVQYGLPLGLFATSMIEGIATLRTPDFVRRCKLDAIDKKEIELYIKEVCDKAYLDGIKSVVAQ